MWLVPPLKTNFTSSLGDPEASITYEQQSKIIRYKIESSSVSKHYKEVSPEKAPDVIWE